MTTGRADLDFGILVLSTIVLGIAINRAWKALVFLKDQVLRLGKLFAGNN